jgi:hypothetical protein
MVFLVAAALTAAAGCQASSSRGAAGGTYGDMSSSASRSGSSGSSGIFGSEDSGAVPIQVAAEKRPFLSEINPRKLIYTASLTILVSDVKRAIESTRRLAEGMGGYMQEMTSEAIVIRVPAAKFEDAREALAKMGPVKEQNITAQDVTDEYVDVDIRLKNAKALLEKLQALLAKAQNVKEALDVEKELARVRTEIETLEGRLNLLTNRIAYSTISVAFQRMEEASRPLKATLPFYWLQELGLHNLLAF